MADRAARPGPVDIKSLDRDGLRLAIEEHGAPAYRARQLERQLYARGALSFGEMTDLPAALREKLSTGHTLGVAQIVSRQISSDGTRKYLVGFPDGVSVECVGLPEGTRLTACFSTQAGCAMGCSFCATGMDGFVRDLTPGEMVDQVRAVAEDFGRRVSNVVAMGQGEPFACYDATLAALRFMNSPDGLGVGARHIVVSTCGLLPGIARFAEEPEQFTLAVSVHSAVQATRDRLMPGVRGMALADLRQALVAYARRSGRRPTLEYALITGVNDTVAEIDALASFCEGLRAHVNLIPANPVAGTAFVAPPAQAAASAARRLSAKGIEASVRRERGADIDAACGQLRRRDG